MRSAEQARESRTSALDRLFRLCRNGVASLEASPHAAARSQIRGTGPGCSFRDLVDEALEARPVLTRRPFEESPAIAGGGWIGRELDTPHSDEALIFLEFDAHAGDLPMHAHEHSARFIVVLEGRGFFHTTPELLGEFSGRSVWNTAVRERDVIAFRPGVVHTFSTFQHAMTLLSFHAPFIPLDDPRQYTLPKLRWTAAERIDATAGEIRLGGTWTPLIGSDTEAVPA